MTDRSQTTTNTASEPLLCKAGCGFFGNGATGDFCSKCWGEQQKKKEGATANPSPVAKPAPPREEQPPADESPEPMQVEEVTPAAAESAAEPMVVAQTPKKRKKKKANYKNLMAGIRQGAPAKDIEKEKEGLRKVTGGGAFTKIDKI